MQIVIPAALPNVKVTEEEPERNELVPSAPAELVATRNMLEVREALERLSERLERSENVIALECRLEAQERQIERQERQIMDLQGRIGTPLMWMLLGAVIMGVLAAGIAISLLSLSGGA